MILEEIILKTKERYEGITDLDINKIKLEIAPQKDKKDAFYKALNNNDFNFICEVKKASPSKGLIKENFNYLEIAKIYEANGASVISCLTEPDFFLGNKDYLTNIKSVVKIPVLRKDFIINEYQIYESKKIGADAILLICSILTKKELEDFLNLAHSLDLGVLVEAHDLTEINMALESGAKVIGVNNRNLKDFSVDMNNSINLRKYVPNSIIFISESGIRTNEDIKLLKDNNVNGVLIGETLMKSNDIGLSLRELMR